MWEIWLDSALQERWKLRRETYEKGIKEDLLKDEKEKKNTLCQESCSTSVNECRQQQAQKRMYETISEASVSSAVDALLLPSVVVPDVVPDGLPLVSVV